MRLLLAEDEKDISKALVTVFEKNNYCIDAVYNGNDAFDYGITNNYDGIILDIMMPGMDGIQVVKKLRENNISTPILMLTAKSEISDRIEGLDSGADDYLPKPFAISELLARVRAMLRRRSDYQPDLLNINGVILNKSTYEIQYNNKEIRLVSREFQVLEMLMENLGQIVTTDSIMEHIWGWDSDVEVSIVWVTISNLRKKFASLKAPINIKSVRGVGYRLK